MHIVVCVKAVPASTEVRMDPVTHTIVRDAGASVINPFDAAALELALQLRDERAQAGEPRRVSVLSMGIPATEDILRDCLARGADDALLLSDRAFAGADTLATTYALTCGLRELGVDIAHDAPVAADAEVLILCGKMAVDGDTAQIGPELAGALDIPCVTDVRELMSCAAGLVALRHACDAGIETLAVELPCVLTVAKEAAQPRMPSIAGVLAAADMPVAVRTAASVNADATRTGLAGSPTQVLRSFVPERATEAERIEGTPTEQAARIADLVEEVA